MILMMMNCFCDRFTDKRHLAQLPEILTTANLQHASRRIWTCAEPDFRHFCMKLCSSHNHSTMAPPNHYTTTPLTDLYFVIAFKAVILKILVLYGVVLTFKSVLVNLRTLYLTLHSLTQFICPFVIFLYLAFLTINLVEIGDFFNADLYLSMGILTVIGSI